MITNAATNANNVVGLVYVAAFAPDEGEPLGAIASNSKDSVVLPALVELQYPTGEGEETAAEVTIDPEKFHEVFAFDLSEEQSCPDGRYPTPPLELAFSEPTGVPAWKKLPSWAVVATGDKVVGTDAVRSMAERAGATITEVEGSRDHDLAATGRRGDDPERVGGVPRSRNNAVLGKDSAEVLVETTSAPPRSTRICCVTVR